MKNFRSKPSRAAAREALRVLHKRDNDKNLHPKRHPELTHGARFIHGGPDGLRHPRWTR